MFFRIFPRHGTQLAVLFLLSKQDRLTNDTVIIKSGLNMSNILDLFKNLIRTAPTADKGELKAAEVLAGFFAQNNIKSDINQWDNNRANIVASIGNDDAAAPTLLFGAHLDVVPADNEHWQTDPFEPAEKDGKLFGRGSVDMLGGLCAAADALVQMKDTPLNGRVIFAATAGEETG
jgi:succinyl-diaminopimelate desuccinylase